MNFKIVITPEAKVDLKESSNWYNNKRKGLGLEIVKQIKEKVSQIQELPNSCNIKYKEIHTAVIKQFPFMVHYWVDESISTIYIIAALHTSRNPNWLNE